MFSKPHLAFAFLASAVMATNASATAIETTSFSAWQSTLTGAPIEANFSQLGYSNYSTSAGITLSGVADPTNQFTFTGPDNGGYALNGQNYSGMLSLVGAADVNAGINVAFSGAGQTAFLISVASVGNAPLSIALSDGETFSLSNGVYGFTLPSAITSFFLSTSSSAQPVIDDFYYGVSASQQTGGTGGTNTPSVPEGRTLLLVMGGLLTFVGAKRNIVPRMLRA